ncbi:MAG: arylsulfatase [Acidimicrobiales bacterium]
MADAAFPGVIGRTWRESTPWWPPEPAPPAGAPNVVMIVLDDVGYAQLGCYGSDIDTPNIDGLARDGVRLSNFHTTSLCSPTRACLLTGRNHHSNGMGRVSDLAMGYPGYWGRIPRANGMVAEILAGAGYATAAVGKWHLTPEDETHMAASRSTWPCARGFQRWFGFHGGETHQFVPTLFEDNSAATPARSPEQGYHLTTDLADRAITYLGDIRSASPDAPFLLYFATGACHSPHQAPAEWIDRYRGRFDCGWDEWRTSTFRRQQAAGLLPDSTELSLRPPWVPAWSDLKVDDRRVAARFMECFAGFLSHADHEIGRVLSFVADLGEAANTMVMVVSDNGASAEGGLRGSINDARVWNGDPAGFRELRARVEELGGPSAHNNYPWGWTMAGNTPFRRWKREVHQGGIADPFILRWPVGVRTPGAVRHRFAHAIDVVPTILELAGIDAPQVIDGVEQAPIEGFSFADLLADGPERRRDRVQYFEMLGSRGIFHDGWKAVTYKPLGHLYGDDQDPEAPFEDDVWELYHVERDISECHDLAAERPDKLRALVDRWWSEAERHQVLPLDNRPVAALLAPRRPPADRRVHRLHPHGAVVPETVAPNVRNRPHRIRALVDLGAGDEGVILAMGTVLGGWSFHLRAGRMRYVNNYLGKERHVVVAEAPVGAGPHELKVEYEPEPAFAATVRLILDGAVVGAGRLEHTTPVRYSITGGGLTCGWEQGPAVGDGYDAPFRFTGHLRRVTIEVDGAPHRDGPAEFDAIMAEQ